MPDLEVGATLSRQEEASGGIRKLSTPFHFSFYNSRRVIRISSGTTRRSRTQGPEGARAGQAPFDHCGQAIEKYGLTREEVDAYALASQQTAHRAQQAGWLAEEIVPVTVKDRKGKPVEITQDEGIRDTTMESLAKLPARFRQGGVVTAGNTSNVNDAGACVIVATADAVKQHNLKPIARLVSWGIAGSHPRSWVSGRPPQFAKRSNAPI